jgi:hypothetical protein
MGRSVHRSLRFIGRIRQLLFAAASNSACFNLSLTAQPHRPQLPFTLGPVTAEAAEHGVVHLVAGVLRELHVQLQIDVFP